jgi:hypothetical protein
MPHSHSKDAAGTDLGAEKQPIGGREQSQRHPRGSEIGQDRIVFVIRQFPGACRPRQELEEFRFLSLSLFKFPVGITDTA